MTDQHTPGPWIIDGQLIYALDLLAALRAAMQYPDGPNGLHDPDLSDTFDLWRKIREITS